MSCKPFKTTEANAKSFLRTKGAIDKFLNIIDLNKFRQYHAELKQQVKKYIPDFQDNLFFELDGGKKASPNKNIFQQIDNSKGIYYSKITPQQKQQAISKFQEYLTTSIKPGVSELFESNPELANAVYSKILTNSGLSAENLLSLLLKDNLIEKQCS